MHVVASDAVMLPLVPQQICPAWQSAGPIHVMAPPPPAVHAVAVIHTVDADPIPPAQRVAQHTSPVAHVGHEVDAVHAAASPPLPELDPLELPLPELEPLLEPLPEPLPELPPLESGDPPSSPLLFELSEDPQPMANARPMENDTTTGRIFIGAPRAV